MIGLRVLWAVFCWWLFVISCINIISFGVRLANRNPVDFGGIDCYRFGGLFPCDLVSGQGVWGLNADFYLCDVCGTKTKNRFHPYLGRRMDAAGETDDIQEIVDLCEECMGRYLKHVILRRGHIQRRQVLGGSSQWKKEKLK